MTLTISDIVLILVLVAIVVGALLVVQWWALTYSIVGGLASFLAKLTKGDRVEKDGK